MLPSSTSSSEPTAGPSQPPPALGSPSSAAWFAAVRYALALLFIVAAVDVSLRKLAPFELHDDWEHQQIAWKQEKLRNFVQSRQVDVLLLGSSVTMNLDAKRLGRRTHASVFNGGVGGANPTAMAAIFEHAYLKLARPKLLVYGLSARDLRDTDEDPYDQPPFLSHRMRAIRARTWQERVEVLAERYSYLFRVRRQLRDFAQRGELPGGVEIKTDDYGSRKHKSNGLARALKGRREFPRDYAYRSRYRDYRIDMQRGHVRQLLSLIERTKSLGIPMVLVNIPLSPAAMSLFDHPEADYQLYLKTLSEVSRQTGVELFDAHTELQLSNADFADADHMGQRGDAKTEDYLVPIVARLLGRDHD